tara:strand:- start:61205 stop:62152 length:948 start_codon:yes stop_codon:yes gene_type:complete
MLEPNKINKATMPDIAHQTKSENYGTLDRVGMTDVQIPLILSTDGKDFRVAAKADLFVNLIDPEAKGIHMSRLFLKAQESFEKNTFDLQLLKNLLSSFIESHKDLSDEAFIRLKFDYLTLRSALLSDFAGWRSYPVVIEAKQNSKGFHVQLHFEIMYSSTCPCSAALSRQALQEHFDKSFSSTPIDKETVHQWLGEEKNMAATPHSQRSLMQAKIRFQTGIQDFDIEVFIDRMEAALSTPVQTAVKREDEQEFARLNAANLMFCEDAARRAKQELSEIPQVDDFWLKVEHLESLHPHNAVSIATKGVEGGFKAES